MPPAKSRSPAAAAPQTFFYPTGKPAGHAQLTSQWYTRLRRQSPSTLKTGREAVEAMEQVKHSKYDRCCTESNVALVPFVLSTFGLLGSEAERLFHSITAAARRRAVVDDSSVDRAQYLQQLLISLNREIARQLLQGPLDCAAGADALAAPEPGCDRAEAQDDLDQVAAALDPDAMLITASAVTSAAADTGGVVVMCGHANAPTVNNVAPPVENTPADVSMQEAEPPASDSTPIMLFVRRATSSDTLPVYIVQMLLWMNSKHICKLTASTRPTMCCCLEVLRCAATQRSQLRESTHAP